MLIHRILGNFCERSIEKILDDHLICESDIKRITSEYDERFRSLSYNSLEMLKDLKKMKDRINGEEFEDEEKW